MFSFNLIDGWFGMLKLHRARERLVGVDNVDFPFLEMRYVFCLPMDWNTGGYMFVMNCY